MNKKKIDKPRASKDGNEYHEIWAARKSLQLLLPGSNLAGIAVEGLSPEDQPDAIKETTDIADLTLYYGKQTNFRSADRIFITQFKYTIADQDNHYRASHAKKTIQKFAKSFTNYLSKSNVKAVTRKVRFQIYVNRPVFPALGEALTSIIQGTSVSEDVLDQKNQYSIATGLTGEDLVNFTKLFSIVSLAEDLPASKHELSKQIVDWSTTNDAQAQARLGKLKQMVRDKAGYAGTRKNIIRKTDLYEAFDISDTEELLPCPSALPDVGEIVERSQMPEILDLVERDNKPVLVTAAGGVGKTVLLESLSAKLALKNKVILFDCFGGGAYRSPEDCRHLANRGLLHIINSLAVQGLCDPILPYSQDETSLLKTFRRRATQCIASMRRSSPKSQLFLIIDAIDNAHDFAKMRNENSFPVLLLESLHERPIEGLKLILACRPNRKPNTFADLEYVELQPFSLQETCAYLNDRVENVTSSTSKVAQSMSGGNPRVLEYLVKENDWMNRSIQTVKEISVDELIQSRINDALKEGLKRGYSDKQIESFLAGLAVLPPPVPIQEYAEAHGMEVSAVESFIADLFPLLEVTNQGVMFRDEPTETLIRKQYSASEDALHEVADNLLNNQDQSVYAARALPNLLQCLNDGNRLFDLAFETRFPKAINSVVGKRNIQYSRLKAAVAFAASQNDYDKLVHLLVELSKIASVDAKGIEYIISNPDLIVASKDVDATRRLFEAKTSWPATRHARLTIANTLYGDINEAHRNVRVLEDWVQHYLDRDQDNFSNSPRPDKLDLAAILFFRIANNDSKSADRYLKIWQSWYAFKITKISLQLLNLGVNLGTVKPKQISNFIETQSQLGPLTAILSYTNPNKKTTEQLIGKLAKACKRATKLTHEQDHYGADFENLRFGLQASASIAFCLKNKKEAGQIHFRTQSTRPRFISSFSPYQISTSFDFVFSTALSTLVKDQSLHEKDLLPQDLYEVSLRIPKKISGDVFIKAAKKAVSKNTSTAKQPNLKFDYENSREATAFLNNTLPTLKTITSAFREALRAKEKELSSKIENVLDHLSSTYSKPHLDLRDQQNQFFRKLCQKIGIFICIVRSDLTQSAIAKLIEFIDAPSLAINDITTLIEACSRRSELHEFAGKLSVIAHAKIEMENEVSSRANYLSDLSRSMLPVSIEEGSIHFIRGLEQMDAIGSGDYEFLNELLLFAATVNGPKLPPQDFHTLSNICEINLSDEPEKFFWGAFSNAMSKVAGPAMLAKLSRWDDRSKIDLGHTLLPYLISMSVDKEISPVLAVSLNNLASPVEYHQYGTKEFLDALLMNPEQLNTACVLEVINQYIKNNPYSSNDDIFEKLIKLSEQVRIESIRDYLSSRLSISQIERKNQRYKDTNIGIDPGTAIKREEKKLKEEKSLLEEINHNIDPTDYSSFSKALSELDKVNFAYDLQKEVFKTMRGKVPYGQRSQYLKNLLKIENFHFYWVLDELEKIINAWGKDTLSLQPILTEHGVTFLHRSFDDLISHGRLSGFFIHRISKLTKIPTSTLAIELIAIISNRKEQQPGPVWLALATYACSAAKEGEGQKALSRLLNSESALLANSAEDGPWKAPLYPDNDIDYCAAALIWRNLGSVDIKQRWRAIHTIVSLAKTGQWNVINEIAEIARSDKKTAFHAEEQSFFHFHAHLWHLIAICRLSGDYPEYVSKFKDTLIEILSETELPHVLKQHFAQKAILNCKDSGHLTLSKEETSLLQQTNLSPFPRLMKKTKRHGLYHDRPDDAPKRKIDFHFDYDFEKHDLDWLASVFGKNNWEIENLVIETISQISPDVESTHDRKGRESRYRDYSYSMGSGKESYGYQVAWHATMIAAGILLQSTPVTDDSWMDLPWEYWLSRYCLSRSDGYLLSDSIEYPPLNTLNRLNDHEADSVNITGDKNDILPLLGIQNDIQSNLVLDGRWHSLDSIRVRISSALISPENSTLLIAKLITEDPMTVWLPYLELDDEGGEYSHSERESFEPFIVSPSHEGKLDEHDPLGIAQNFARPHLSAKYLKQYNLKQSGPLKEKTLDDNAETISSSHVWGLEDIYNEGGPYPGHQLLINSDLLRNILQGENKNLIILINLQHYRPSSRYSDEKSQYHNTVSIVEINQSLEFKYYSGATNKLYEPKY